MVRFKWGLFIVVAFLAISCQKVQEDKIPPTIVLNGNNPDTVLVGCNYKDPGAETRDDKDGEVYWWVSGEINSDSAGVGYLDYTAVDADSNYAYQQRKVVVLPLTEDFFVGNFYAIDTLLNIPRIITNYLVSVDKLGSNLFRMSNFNDLGNSFQVLIQPDSTGSFVLDYNSADTIIIQGQGNASCNGKGFRISYTVEMPGSFKTHFTTYEK